MKRATIFATAMVVMINMAYANNDDGNELVDFSCQDMTNDGWKNMPPIAEYIRRKPNSGKLGFGGECA